MKVLKLKWKYDHVYFDASTKEKEALAFLGMVLMLDKDLQAYVCLEEETEDLRKEVDEIRALKGATVPGVLKGHAEDMIRNLEDKERDLEKQEEQLTLYRTVKDKKKPLAERTDAARKLAYSRKDYEYEEFAFVDVVDPSKYAK